MFVSHRLQSAFELALEVHGDQLRKGTRVPYLTHLLAVCALVGEHGGDEDLMAAALLHDTLEDRPEQVSVELLVQRFGWRVANVVVGCSDCTSKPKAPWEPRKKAFLARLVNASPDIKLVAAADKLHNASSLVRDFRIQGDPDWSRFNAPKELQCWYLRGCVQAMRNGWRCDIVELLDETVTELERLCGVSTGT